MRTDIGHTVKKTHHSPARQTALRDKEDIFQMSSRFATAYRTQKKVIFVKGEIQGERETLAQVLWRSTSESSAPSRSLEGHSLKYHRMARGRCARDRGTTQNPKSPKTRSSGEGVRGPFQQAQLWGTVLRLRVFAINLRLLQ